MITLPSCGRRGLLATVLLGSVLCAASSGCRTARPDRWAGAVHRESVLFTEVGDEVRVNSTRTEGGMTVASGTVFRLERRGTWAADEVWEDQVK